MKDPVDLLAEANALLDQYRERTREMGLMRIALDDLEMYDSLESILDERSHRATAREAMSVALAAGLPRINWKSNEYDCQGAFDAAYHLLDVLGISQDEDDYLDKGA